MGHNVSRTRQTHLAEDQDRADALRWLVPGWTVTMDPPFSIQCIPTMAGAHQRGQILLYRCLRSDCGRRVQPDLDGLVRGGFGHLTAGELRHRLLCAHPLGCRLSQAVETYPRGVPLIAYVQRHDHLIAVSCQRCRHTVSRTAEDTITRLRVARRGDASTGINELASRVRGPCRKCGGMVFAAEVVRPQAPGTGLGHADGTR